MGVEIERKFLVERDDWRQTVTSSDEILQGYITRFDHCHVRVRVKKDQGIITLKGQSQGIARSEFEYKIPLDDARAMIDEFCREGLIKKTRHHVNFSGHDWVIDEFHGDNSGLVMAEVEIPSLDTHVDLPGWAGKEVSQDNRYFNAYLSQHPFSKW